MRRNRNNPVAGCVTGSPKRNTPLTRYLYCPDHPEADRGWVEKDKAREWQAQRSFERTSDKRSDFACPRAILPDLNAAYPEGGFRSPIDDTWISSRSQLRAHNARHGVIQTGDIRGPQIRENMKRYMQYDPSLIGKDFSWGKPE